jgi:dienelactone hydrolase
MRLILYWIDVTGSRDANKAIIFIYDVFGPSPQALQGADRISQHLTGDCLVILPDFFRGQPLRPDELSKAGEFLQGPGAFGPNADVLRQDVVPAILRKFPQLGEAQRPRLGAFGLCWGGKITVLAAVNVDTEPDGSSPFRVTGQGHPGRLDAEDAKKLDASHICLASKDEDKDVVAQYAEVLASSSPDSVVKTYERMFHGWMGARANLEDEENRQEYEKGYLEVAEFFSKHL